MASYGSIALYHIVGVTPEARRRSDVASGNMPEHIARRRDIEALEQLYRKADKVDVVVFSAPQLSILEMRTLAQLCEGRRFILPVLAITSPQVKPDADRMGTIEAAGGTVLSGMCFYQSYAREMAEAKGWRRLATNSAKMVNILGGYGYVPLLASMEACVDAAETGMLT
jgi:predicted aconitase